MKKQRKRIYTALLCTCFLFSTASVPVSAAETEQEEEMTTLSSRSGEAEVSTVEDLTSALGDSTKDTVKLTANIIIDTTLTVNRAVTLDLNGFVLRIPEKDSVIKVEQGGELTIADSDKTTEHKFAQNPDGLWVLVSDDSTTSKTVKGGIITGGKAQKGGGVYVAPGGKLNMTGGSIVGCQAKFGGGVYLDNNDQTGEPSEFTMTSSRIIGCTASDNGGGVAVNPACTFTMNNGSEIRSCTARNGGGVYTNTSRKNGNGVFTLRNGAILSCMVNTSEHPRSRGGGVYNEGSFIMENGTIKGCTAIKERLTGGVYNLKEFTMSGGTIGEAGKTDDESHVYNAADTAAVFTISGTAKIYTNVANDSRLNADGGEIFGEVTNAVKNWSSAVIAGTEGAADSTEFKGKVTNNCIIEKGQFTGEVVNGGSGTIRGGAFKGSVTNNLGAILGGDFSQATLSGELAITFDPDNGEEPDTQKVDWSHGGATLTAPSEPTKEEHTFEGWYYDNNGENTEWNFETDRAKYTMRLTAQWKANTYTVTVKDDGNGTALADPASAKMGAEVRLTAMPNSGYHFKEWEVIPDKVKIEDNKFTMPAAHVTVKAIFERNTSSGSGGGGGGGTTYYTLTFETNGGDSMQAIRAARGKTLDLSAYTPMRDGYDFGGWYADKALTQRITEIKLSGSKTVYADWKKREPNEPDAVKNPFADVNAGDWFYRDVLFSYEKGLMSGMDTAVFAPYANTTRAQIAVIFYRMEGSPAVEGENSFTDVVRDSGTAWFYDAVTWAQKNGIMGGYGNSSFAPNDPITREQLAAIFYRYAQYKGYDTTQGGMAIREFDDYESISDYAMGAMAWAVNTGLVKGDSNLLYPKGTATRAELAALFHRFAENGMK
ncbi:MAG: S-layer homology domain-containing protein [Anaerotignum faecicola]